MPPTWKIRKSHSGQEPKVRLRCLQTGDMVSKRLYKHGSCTMHVLQYLVETSLCQGLLNVERCIGAVQKWRHWGREGGKISRSRLLLFKNATSIDFSVTVIFEFPLQAGMIWAIWRRNRWGIFPDINCLKCVGLTRYLLKDNDYHWPPCLLFKYDCLFSSRLPLHCRRTYYFDDIFKIVRFLFWDFFLTEGQKFFELICPSYNTRNSTMVAVVYHQITLIFWLRVVRS